MNDAIKKLAEDNKTGGENANAFQNNKQLDKNLSILYADKDAVDKNEQQHIGPPVTTSCR